MSANFVLLNIPLLRSLFNLKVQDLVNALRVDCKNPLSASDIPSFGILLLVLLIFQLIFKVLRGDLKNGRVRDKTINNELLQTLSVSFLKILAVNPSTHSSSFWEVVACQRYKQLNWMERLEMRDRGYDRHKYLNAANVPATSFKDAMILLPKLAKHVQAPGIPLPDQAKNGREVVGKDNHTEPAAVNRPCGLEDLIVLLGDDCIVVSAWGDGIRVVPRVAFVDLQEFLSNVLDVMKSGSDWKECSGDKGARIHCDCG